MWAPNLYVGGVQSLTSFQSFSLCSISEFFPDKIILSFLNKYYCCCGWLGPFPLIGNSWEEQPLLDLSNLDGLPYQKFMPTSPAYHFLVKEFHF